MAAVQKLQKTYDLVILSEVFHWPGLDILEDDTRAPLLSTLLAMTHAGSIVLLAYKCRDPGREEEMLAMLRPHFTIAPLPLPEMPFEAHDPGSEGIAVCELTKG